ISPLLARNGRTPVVTAECGFGCQMEAPLPKKPSSNHVVKLKRSPLCCVSLTRQSSAVQSKMAGEQTPSIALALSP
ncbi:hypothetical protein JRQ81_019497, partial [Phrynocephalus forsythii]